jgi:hypothetical protein
MWLDEPGLSQYGHGAVGSLMEAYVSGRLVDCNTIEPLLDAARLLVRLAEFDDTFEPLRHGLHVFDAALEGEPSE